MFRLMLSCIVVLQHASTAAGHAAITVPAARSVPAEPYCPWCHGKQDFSTAEDLPKPPSPCWHASGAPNTPDKFNDMADLKDPEGSFWVDHGASEAPVWCPGSSIDISMYIHADHNGIYRWESQLAKPGAEVEASFENFTSWQSINHDANTEYYLITDGKTHVGLDECPGVQNHSPWAPEVEGCKAETFAKTSMVLPDNLAAGPTVIRWLWYGGRDLEGKRVTGPEPSLFINCLDVVIGSAEQCSAPKRRLMLV